MLTYDFGNGQRTTLVCIDSYEHGAPAGQFYDPRLPDGEPFSSLTQFLVKMENVLDAARLPQSFTTARSFTLSPEQADVPLPTPSPQEGRLATFAVRILFRQNASWQGSVAWLEGGREESFRSVLELILLMDSALKERESKSKKRTSASSPSPG